MAESSLERLLREKGLEPPGESWIELDSSRRTIMVVDDESSVRDILIQKLPDYYVAGAESGEQALELYEKARKQEIDIYCVIMDAKMPGMNGWDATNELHKRDKDLPIIMLTAFQDEHSIPEAIDHKLEGYVTKGKTRVSTEGDILLPTLDELNIRLQSACNTFAEVLRHRFFEHVTDPEEKEELIRFSMMFDPGKPIPRLTEDCEIAGDIEAKRYSTGCSYSQNCDYLLFSMELNNVFGLNGKKVTEFCTGPGDLSFRISEYKPSEITGIDGSHSMIEHAKAKHQAPNLEFRELELSSVNSEEDMKNYDIVVCQNSMHHFADERLCDFFEAGIACLRPGGSLYVSDYRRERVLDSSIAQRLLATNRYVRGDLKSTLRSSLTTGELQSILQKFGDSIEYRLFFPDKEYSALKRDPRYWSVVANDPHPHYLDYNLSLRVHIVKAK